ncbi:MAG: hypothetical protein IPP49_00180 [Saprospiraceae bacterium]|nr:hypothetical protein [Saprospiraceae bacterium]
MFLRYGAINWENKKSGWIKKIGISLVISGVLTWLSTYWLQYYSWQYVVMSFTGFFSLISNADYLISVTKGNIKMVSSAIAHLGFGMMIIGILASGLNQKFISTNPFVFKGMFTEDDVKKYVQLIKGKPLLSQSYLITYESDTLIGRERKYSINFKRSMTVCKSSKK